MYVSKCVRGQTCSSREFSLYLLSLPTQEFGFNAHVEDPREVIVAVLPVFPAHVVLDTRNVLHGTVLLNGGFDLRMCHALKVLVPPD